MSRGAYLLSVGLVPYGEAFELQRSLAGAVSQGAIPDVVLFLEHLPGLVEEGRIEPPVDGICAGGQADDVGRLELVAGEVTPVCNTDSIRDPEARKLAYGRIARLPGVDVTCLSEEWGVTCVDPLSEHGFFIARGTFTTF